MSETPSASPGNAEPPRGLDPARFLATHWQRRPLLLRHAFPAFTSPVNGDDLAALACEPTVQARLVTGPDDAGRWQVEYGPFTEARFAAPPGGPWTLLVQDVDKWIPAAGALLDHFRFLPDWRIDDLMVSFAVDGGSVGPHCDHYDVFLLQGAGCRRWAIDDRPDAPRAHRSGESLRLLRHFEPNRSWELEPGDLLYLPPGVPHHGTALGPGLTLSIGFRAPALGELLLDLAGTLATQPGAGQRLTDPGRSPARDPGRIGDDTLAQVQELLASALALEPQELGRWFGAFITRYGAPERPADPAPVPAGDPGDSQVLRRNPWSRWAYVPEAPGARLYVDGEGFACGEPLARALTARRCFSPGELPATPERAWLLRELLARGVLEVAD